MTGADDELAREEGPIDPHDVPTEAHPHVGGALSKRPGA
ncbi:hydrogen peroxide-inducible genes activator [Cutibacterium acnes JCM 18909]|nr:hydrogen peroxide-inducible genes activator [Cutibacterium acnes JCM 18909]